MDPIQVRFYHPAKRAYHTLALDRSTRFSALTPVLYEAGFLAPQKPGYRYIYQGHLCGMNHALGDYIPANAQAMELEIFQFPEVLV